MTSPIVQAYMDRIGRAAFAGFDDSATVGQQTADIPDPLEDTDPNRSYTQFNIFRPSTVVSSGEEPVEGEDGGAGETVDSTTTTTSSSSSFADTPLGYIENKVEETLDYIMGIPTEVNPLTNTVRATGPGKLIGAVMPLPMSALVTAGAALSQANLENINESVLAGTPGYGVGLLNNQIVGVSPNPISTNVFGMSPTDAGVLSGTIPDAPPGITQEAYEAAIKSALIDAAVPATPPGIGPATTSIVDITDAVNLDVFGTADGQDMGLPGGYVTSSVENPMGINPATGEPYADISVPVRTLDLDTGKPKGYVTQGNNPPDGELGFSGFTATEVGTQTGFDVTGALSPEDIADTTTPDAPAQDNNPNEEPEEAPGDDNNDGNTGSDDTGGPSGGDPGGPGSGGSNPDDDGDGPGGDDDGGVGSDPDGPDWAMGGRIGMRLGGEAFPQRGFVNKDPRNVSDSQGIADNRFTSVPQGSFVMNQPANEKYKDDLDVVLGDAEKRAGKARKNASMIDVALSDGERLIRPEVVNFIEKKYGGGFLDNINNTGKPEVKRRQVKYGAKI